MLPQSLLPQFAVHRRRTDDVLTGKTFPFTQALTVTTSLGAVVMCVAAGLASDLTVSVSGALDLVNQSEDIIVSPTTGIARSTKFWTSVTQIAVAGSQAGTLRCSLRDSGNQPIFLETQLDAALPCRLVRRRTPRVEIADQGSQYVSTYTCFTQPTADVRVADRLVIGGAEYEVDHVYHAFDRSTHHHSESVIRLLA